MTTVKSGSRGADVVKLQKKLHLYPDGVFGPITLEAVKDFQRQNGLAADGVVGPRTWAALGETANPHRITEIIVHCTATPEGRDFTVEQIRQCHLARNFSDIGYHYVVYRDGTVHKGRDESVAGAHCTGHNSVSIGICYVGGVADDGRQTPKDTRTPEQRRALELLLKSLLKKYPGARIYSHRDFANKACPSFDATSEYRSLTK